MKKLALPLVAALAVGACATSPAESTDPSTGASIPASSSPTATQPAGDLAATFSSMTSAMRVMRGDWVAFDLDGAAADWTFTFSDPSLVAFSADGIVNEAGTTGPGLLTTGTGELTITATNTDGTVYTFSLGIIN